jgi:NADH-quinone oxidoreductase subunit A
MVGAPTFISRFLRVNRPTKEKLSVYECGVNPIGEARVRFSIKFYLIAMLFILFDIDLVFLYPWAAVHRWLGWFGLAEMAVFIGILMVGFVYIWKRRGFEWE